jgi:hypothetical protein
VGLVLIKWIQCRVSDMDAFGRAQRGWTELSAVEGFLGQCGGWSEPGVAQIVAFWRNQLDYENFMTGAHDRIAESQAGTYDGIDVRLFDHHLDVGAGLPAGGSVARLAHCHVKAGRQEHFVLAQATVWNPGMVAAPGMRGGVFGRRGDAEFLVLSQWNSTADHEQYRTDRFPELRRRSDAADDLDSITGALVELDPSWIVRPQVGQP